MRSRSKFVSVLLAALLVALTVTPLFASAQEPTAERWYLKGDFNINEIVDADDARSIMRIAAYLDAAPEAGSPLYDAADFDQDGVITTKDARAVLRVAAYLDNAPAQVQRTSVPIAIDDAIAMINADANALKTYGSATYKWPFSVKTVSKVMSASADNRKFSGAIFGISDLNIMRRQINEELDKTVNDMRGETTETNVSNIIYNADGSVTGNGKGYGDAYYKRYLEVLSANHVMKMDAAKSLIKSVSYYPSATGGYEIVFYFNDETMSDDASANLLANVMSVTLPGEASADMGLDGEGVTFGTITDVYKNAHVRYKFQYETDENGEKYARPILAEYYYEMALSIPVTMSINIEGSGLGSFGMTLNTTNMVAKTYMFDSDSFYTTTGNPRPNV